MNRLKSLWRFLFPVPVTSWSIVPLEGDPSRVRLLFRTRPDETQSWTITSVAFASLDSSADAVLKVDGTAQGLRVVDGQMPLFLPFEALTVSRDGWTSDQICTFFK